MSQDCISSAQRPWSPSLPRARGTLEEIARQRKRRALLINVLLILLIGLILSISSAITNAASSPFVIARIPSSHSPSPTVTIGETSTDSTTAGEEAKAIPLTLIDLIGTLVAALIPALIGGLFIVARRHFLRKREQIEWSNQIQLTLEEEWLDDQGEEDPDTREQEEQLNGIEDEALQQLLSHASVTNESAHSRLSRLKCRLRSLQESLPPQ